MKLNLFKIYFGAALTLLSANTIAAAPLLNIAENDTLLIDDFEDGDFNSELGIWETFNKEDYVTTFERSIVDSDKKHGKVLRISYEFPDAAEQQNGNWEWVETRVQVAPGLESRDFSNCTEILFDYRAPFQSDYSELDLRFRVEGDEINAYVETNYHFARLEASDEWQSVKFHWSDFEQEGWWGVELPVKTVQQNLIAFSWFWHSDNAATGSLEIDNLRCANKPVYEVKFIANDTLFYSQEYYGGETPEDPAYRVYYNSQYVVPTKSADDTYMYTFTGWDPAELTPVMGPTVYTAQFDSEKIPVGAALNMTKDTLTLEDFENGDNVGSLGGSWEFYNSAKPNGSSFESTESEWSGDNPAVSFDGSFKESEYEYDMNVHLTDYVENNASFDYCFAFFGEDVAVPKGWSDRQFAEPADLDFSDEWLSMPLCKNGESGHVEFDSYGGTYPLEGNIRIKVKADGEAEGTEYMLLKIMNLSGAALALDTVLGGIPFKIFDIDKVEVQEPASSVVAEGKNKVLGIGNLAETETSYEWLGARLYLLKDSSAVDMSQCEAILYRYKGESHEFRVESEYENGWQHYHKYFPSSDDWTTNIIYWNRLEGFDWIDEGNLPLKEVDVIKKKVVALTWQKDYFSIDADGKGSIEIDDIQCVRNLPEVLVAFYNDGKKVDEYSYAYATYFRNVSLPKDPVKPSENGMDYVFADWTPTLNDDFQITENTKFEATFVQSKKIHVSVFDDFEDGDKVGELGGAWSISNSVSKRASKDAIVDIAVAGDKENKWLKAKFKNEPDVWTRADVVLSMQEDGSAVDLSECEAIQYDYRESTDYHQFHMGSAFDDLEIERDYYKTIEREESDAETWHTETVYFESMWCNNGCKPVSKVQKAVLQLSWSFENYGNEETFEIDNIKCIAKSSSSSSVSSSSSAESSSSSSVESSSSSAKSSSSSVESLSSSSEAKSSSSSATSSSSSANSSSSAKSSSSELESSSSEEEEHTTLVYGGMSRNVQVGFANKTLTVSLEKSSPVRVHVFDMKGQLLEQFSETIAGSRNFDLNHLRQGGYIVRVSSGNISRTIRISVK